MPRQRVPTAVKPERSARMANHCMALPKRHRSRSVNRKNALPPAVKRWLSARTASRSTVQQRHLPSRNANRKEPELPARKPERNNTPIATEGRVSPVLFYCVSETCTFKTAQREPIDTIATVLMDMFVFSSILSDIVRQGLQCDLIFFIWECEKPGCMNPAVL